MPDTDIEEEIKPTAEHIRHVLTRFMADNHNDAIILTKDRYMFQDRFTRLRPSLSPHDLQFHAHFASYLKNHLQMKMSEVSMAFAKRELITLAYNKLKTAGLLSQFEQEKQNA